MTGPGYYDELYRATRGLVGHSELYGFVCSRIVENDRVLDLGCGPGHLARRLLDQGLAPLDYVGLDWSEVALQLARERCPEAIFEHGTLPRAVEPLLDWSPTVAVLIEVLEHLERDLETLEALPKALRVLATVPKFDAPGHLRHFAEPADLARYDSYLDVKYVGDLEHWWAVEACRR